MAEGFQEEVSKQSLKRWVGVLPGKAVQAGGPVCTKAKWQDWLVEKQAGVYMPGKELASFSLLTTPVGPTVRLGPGEEGQGLRT